MLRLDLREAFDLVDHDILLQKLKIYGFDDIGLKWFTYKKENKKDLVNNVLSENETIISEVKQGSVL